MNANVVGHSLYVWVCLSFFLNRVVPLLFSSTAFLSDRVISCLNMYVDKTDGLTVCDVYSRIVLPHSAVRISHCSVDLKKSELTRKR